VPGTGAPQAGRAAPGRGYSRAAGRHASGAAAARAALPAGVGVESGNEALARALRRIGTTPNSPWAKGNSHSGRLPRRRGPPWRRRSTQDRRGRSHGLGTRRPWAAWCGRDCCATPCAREYIAGRDGAMW